MIDSERCLVSNDVCDVMVVIAWSTGRQRRRKVLEHLSDDSQEYFSGRFCPPTAKRREPGA